MLFTDTHVPGWHHHYNNWRQCYTAMPPPELQDYESVSLSRGNDCNSDPNEDSCTCLTLSLWVSSLKSTG